MKVKGNKTQKEKDNFNLEKMTRMSEEEIDQYLESMNNLQEIKEVLKILAKILIHRT